MAIKLHRGGKYGRNIAGTPRTHGGDAGPVKREFKGTDLTRYTFQDKEHGVRTIIAHSYEEALRIAESLGFKRSDFKRKRKYT